MFSDIFSRGSNIRLPYVFIWLPTICMSKNNMILASSAPLLFAVLSLARLLLESSSLALHLPYSVQCAFAKQIVSILALKMAGTPSFRR
jgi:hypothetical protein